MFRHTKRKSQPILLFSCAFAYLLCPGWEVFEGEEGLPLLDVRIDLVDNLHCNEGVAS
jgi:hypothetical protein